VKRVLVIEDDEVIRSNILDLLEEEGFDGHGAGDGKSGVAAALARRPDVVVCDIMMPVMDGHEVLRTLRDYPETAAVPFIFLTARAQRSDVREGMSLGADDYLTKPFTRHELLDSIRTRLERQDVLTSMLAPSSPAGPVELPGVVVRAPAMEALHAQAMRAAQSNLSVLLLGETGVGKDVLAHTIHKVSPRGSRPYVPLNCAALAESLLESELFGYEKGAFTGASQTREGLFEAAHGGTVFLDEVGELPKATQAKLLRVIEDRRVMRVGGRQLRDVDVRFIAATNRDLEAEASEGHFRQDLFFRIGGVILTIPPLRDRCEEIEPLAMRFVTTACQKLGRSRAPELADETVRALHAYEWPGNVRELRNAMEQIVAMSDETVIRPSHLPPRVLSAESTGAASSEMSRLEAQMRSVERQRIVDALEQCGGNQTKAADILGISRRTLLHRLDEFDLPRPRKK
jgi:DNA-binding NtrC family response regulator